MSALPENEVGLPANMPVRTTLPAWAYKVLWRKNARHFAIFGGRGAGKSYAVAKALILQASVEHHRVLCCREIQKSTKDSVHRLLSDEIHRMGLADLFVITDSEIRGPHGSIFLFAGLRHNVSQIKSMEGITDVWIEEAQTISQPSIDVLLPTVRAPGSRFFWTWNPGQPDDPVDAMFRPTKEGATPPPGTVLRRVNYDRNPWFPEELRVQMEYDRRADYDKFLHTWKGEFYQNSDTKVFRNWQVADFETPTNATRRLGMDFGFSVDPTALLSCFLGRWENGVAVADDHGRHLFVDYESWEKGCEIDKLPQLMDAVPGSREWQVVADSSRPETISYLRGKGFPKIAASVKGAGSVVEGVEFLQAYTMVVHPRCEHVAEELGSYRYKTDPRNPAVVLPKLEDKNNHCMDALRYALEGLRRAVVAQERATQAYSSTPPRMVTAWSR